MTAAPADSTVQVKEAIESHNEEIDAAAMGVDFRNGENTVLSYKDMSPDQRSSFQDYIIGEGGLKSVYGDVLGAVGGALEEARARRIQARDE